ncbi:MAG: PaaI family thioesterase [Actinomycetota bacterium]
MREDVSNAMTDIPDEYSPPFHRTLGVQMKLGANGEGIAYLTVDPEKHYGNRWAHGGVVPALVDIASGICIARAIPDAMNVIDGTVELKVNFLRKVIEGDITATARLVRAGKRIAVTDVDVTNGDRLVAKAIATFMLARDRAST